MRRPRTDAPAAPPTSSARATALRMLAQRRLTASQLWERLERRGYARDDVRTAVERCTRDGFIDDALFARLFIDGRGKAVGDARLVAELVQRGIDREAARESVASTDGGEDARLATAVEKVYRTRPGIAYPNAARALALLGFPTPAIYRALRDRAAADLDAARAAEDSLAALP